MNDEIILNAPKFLFGAGGAASWVLSGFHRAEIDIVGFLDDSSDLRPSINSLPVIHPDINDYDLSYRASSIVIFSVMNPNVDENLICIRLRDLGWGYPISISKFGIEYLRLTGRKCGMLSDKVLERHMPGLAIVKSLLSDDHSRQVFDGYLSFLDRLDDSSFPSISSKPYFPDDVPRWSNPLRIIDCGSFDGDTLRMAMKCGYTLDSSICFEPDPVNFLSLSRNIKDIPGAEAWPCGVSQSVETLRFSAQGGTGSFVSSNGEISIQCVGIDQAIPHFAPNLIKFDVEGSEYDALVGAKEVIKKFRPGLAVSVYHLSEDIYRIPIFLSDILGSNCDFYLRRHSRTIADTVLYVFPR
jgi:FkbM family methyltransferase